MDDSTLENHLTDVEQRQRQDQVVAQIHEILLLARHQQQTEQTLEQTAAQPETNPRAIADLQTILRDQYWGNGQSDS